MENLLTTLFWIAVGIGAFVFRQMEERRKKRASEHPDQAEPFEPAFELHFEPETPPIHEMPAPPVNAPAPPPPSVSEPRRVPPATTESQAFRPRYTPREARQAFIAAEVFGKPKSLRRTRSITL